jgi:23S rRNA pseudouridine2605 synthase
MERLGLGKYLIRECHSLSSRSVRSLLSSHRVTVNGVIETSYSRKVTRDYHICIDGVTVRDSSVSIPQKIQIQETNPYVLVFCKPCGVISSLSDEAGRSDLSAVIPQGLWRAGLHPVGRLDHHSCGLLLFTTDGRLTRLLLDPLSLIPRQYECVVTGAVDFDNLCLTLQTGVQNRFGEPYFARLVSSRVLGEEEQFEHQTCSDGNRRYDGPIEDASIEWIDRSNRDGGVYSVVVVEVCEGKQRMVRRMLAHCGHHVVNLRRIRYGNITLGELTAGQTRECTETELRWAIELLRPPPRQTEEDNPNSPLHDPLLTESC